MPTYKVPIYDLRLLTKAPMPMGKMGNSTFKSNVRTLQSMYGYDPDYKMTTNFVYGKPLGDAIYRNTNNFESLKYDLWKASVLSDDKSFYYKNESHLDKVVPSSQSILRLMTNIQSKVNNNELSAEQAMLIVMSYFQKLMSTQAPPIYKGFYLSEQDAIKILNDCSENPNAQPTKEMYASDLLATCYFSSEDFKKGGDYQRLFFSKMDPFLDRVYDLISKVSSSIIKGEISLDVAKKFIVERFQEALKSGEMNTSFDKSQRDSLVSASEWETQSGLLKDETLGIDRTTKTTYEEISDGNNISVILLKAIIGVGILGGLTALVVKKA